MGGYRESPIFSIIIPAYNRGDLIHHTISSVLNQSFSDFEMIIVDDASTDNTAEVITSFSDPRIKFYRNKANHKQMATANIAMSKAMGVYLAFLDSDDLWTPNMLSKQWEKYQSDPEISCVYTHTDILNPDGSVSPNIRGNAEGYIFRQVLERGYLCNTSGIGMKRSCLDVIGFVDTRFTVSFDDVLCYALAKYFKFGLIPEPLSFLRVGHSGRVSADPRFAFDWWMLFNNYKDDIIRHCGPECLSRHFLLCSKRFMSAKAGYVMDMALEACEEALRYDNSVVSSAVYNILTSDNSPEAKEQAIEFLLHKGTAPRSKFHRIKLYLKSHFPILYK